MTLLFVVLVLLLLGLLLDSSSRSHAFVVVRGGHSKTITTTDFLLLSNNSENIIFYSDFDDENKKHPDRDNSESGKRLAREFYETVKSRQQDEENMKRERNAQPFSKRQQIVQDLYTTSSSSASQPQASGTGSPSAGFFTGQGQRVFSFPQDNSSDSRRGVTAASNNNNDQATDFGPLVNDRTLVVQLVVVLAVLSFYVAVGLSGGIDSNPGANEWILETPSATVVENLRESVVGGGEEVVTSPSDTGGVWL